MENDELRLLRDQLKSALTGGESHITFDEALKDFPEELWGVRPEGAPHTAWELLEHMRIAQHDILEFSRDPKHQSPDFPEGYWPETTAPPDARARQTSVKAFRRDLEELEQLIDKGDLFAPLQHGTGQTLLREALLVANHNSYELGQLVFLKRMLATR